MLVGECYSRSFQMHLAIGNLWLFTEVGFFHACIGAATNGLVDTVLGLITQTLISALEVLLTNFSSHPLLEAAENTMAF